MQLESKKYLYDILQAGKDLEQFSEGKAFAESSMTGIMGRMATYSGQEVTWDFAMKSELDLTPESYDFGPRETPQVAMPGKTPLV